MCGHGPILGWAGRGVVAFGSHTLGVVRVSVLGRTSVSADAGAIPVRGDKERMVLAVLAMHDASVPTERLADALWGDRPPLRPDKALQTHILRLRQALGASAIETVDGGYRLAPSVSVDARGFESEVVRMLGAAVADPDRAPALAAALAPWRGDPYADLGEWPPAVAERARLGELRRRAREERLAALVEGGHPDACLADLEDLVADDPLRERPWALLVTALAACGRPALALSAYRRARRVLAEELGIEPGTELREAEALALAGAPASPDARVEVDALWGDARRHRRAGDPVAEEDALRRAVEISETLELRSRADLLVAWSGALRRCDRPIAAVEAVVESARLARLCGDAVRLANAALTLSGATATGIDPHTPVIELLDEALDWLPASPSPLRARLTARLAVTASMSRPSDELKQLTDEARRMAEASGDAEGMAYAFQAEVARFDLDDLDGSRRAAQRVVELADEHDRPEWVVDAVLPLAHALAVTGTLVDAADLLTTVADGRSGSQAQRAQARARRDLLLASTCTDFGGVGDALARARAAEERLFVDPTAAYAAYWGSVGVLGCVRGDVLPDGPDYSGVDWPQTTLGAMAATGVAASMAQRGEAEQARHLLGKVDVDALPTLPADVFWPSLLWATAKACWLLDDAKRASALLPVARDRADLLAVDPGLMFLGAFDHHVGLLALVAGQRTTAGHHLRLGVTRHRELGAHHWVREGELALAST
jgi:DNA-binding SARP family transcriptional activator